MAPGENELIARVLSFTTPHQRTVGYKFDRVTRGCRLRCSCDRSVLASTQTARETLGAFPEHAEQCFHLALV